MTGNRTSEKLVYRAAASEDREGMWTVIYDDPDGNPVEIGTSWGDADLARDVCDLMNMAYEAGREAELQDGPPIWP